MFLHNNSSLFGRMVRDTAEQINNEEEYVLKDYYAVMLIKEATRINPDIVFKGGTCLSKCYKVIDRFSEDVDLGMSCEHATEGMRKRMKKAVVEAADSLNLEILNLDKTRSRREFNRFEILLPGLVPESADVLLVETAVMTPSYPSQVMPIQSFIGEYCEAKGFTDVLEEYGLEKFAVEANSLERTFCDKVFAICDYYLAGDIPQRQSRHVYDLFKLSSILSFDENLLQLFSLVREQRQGLYRCPSAEPGVNVAGVLRTLIVEAPYKADYDELTRPLLYDDVSYETAATSLALIADFLSQ